MLETKDEELFSTFLAALRVAKCKDIHEGLVVLKTYIAILIDVCDCTDYRVVNSFWVAGTKAVECICNKKEDD